VSKVLGRIGDVVYVVDDDGMVSRDGEVIGPVQEVLKFLGGYMEDVPEGKASAAPAAQTAAPRPRRPDLPGVPGGDSVYLRLKGLWNDPGSGRFTPRGFSSAKAFAEQVVGGDLVRDAARVNGKVRARVADNRMSRAGIKAGDVIEVHFKDDDFGRVQVVGKNGKKRWYDVQWSRFDRVEGDGPVPEPEPDVVPEPVPVEVSKPVPVTDMVEARKAALEMLADIPDDPFAMPAAPQDTKPKPLDVFAIGKQVMGGRAFDQIDLTEMLPDAGKNGDVSPLFGYEYPDVVYMAVASALRDKDGNLPDALRRLEQPSTTMDDRVAILHDFVVTGLVKDLRSGPDAGKAEVALRQEMAPDKNALYRELLTAVITEIENRRVRPNVQLFDDPAMPLDQNKELFGAAGRIPIMSVLTHADLQTAIEDAVAELGQYPSVNREAIAEDVVNRLSNLDIGRRMVDAGLDAGSNSSRRKALRDLLGMNAVFGGPDKLTLYGEVIDRAMDAAKRQRPNGPDPDKDLTDLDQQRLDTIIGAGSFMLESLRAAELERVPEPDVPEQLTLAEVDASIVEAEDTARTAADAWRASQTDVVAWFGKRNDLQLTLLDDDGLDDAALSELGGGITTAYTLFNRAKEFRALGSDGHTYIFQPMLNTRGKADGSFRVERVNGSGPEQGRQITLDFGLRATGKAAATWRTQIDELQASLDRVEYRQKQREEARLADKFENLDSARELRDSVRQQVEGPALRALMTREDMPLVWQNNADLIASAAPAGFTNYPTSSGGRRVGTSRNVKDGKYTTRIEHSFEYFPDGGIIERLSIVERWGERTQKTNVFYEGPPVSGVMVGDLEAFADSDRYLTLFGTKTDLDSHKLDKERFKVRRELAEVLLDGGRSVEITSGPKGGVIKANVEQVSRLIPQALLDKRPGVVLKATGGGRSSYTSAYNRLNMATTDPSVALHELGHHLERNPELSKMLWAYYVKRTGGDSVPLEQLSKVTGNPKYEAREKSRPDEFFEAYAGKDYGNAARRSMSPSSGRELFTMGLQGTFFNDKGQRGNGDTTLRTIEDEYAAFILGSLLLASRRDEAAMQVDVKESLRQLDPGYVSQTGARNMQVQRLLDLTGAYPYLDRGEFETVIKQVADDPQVQARVREAWASRRDTSGELSMFGGPEGREAAAYEVWDAVMDELVRRAPKSANVNRTFVDKLFNSERIEPDTGYLKTTKMGMLAGSVADSIMGRGSVVSLQPVMKDRLDSKVIEVAGGTAKPETADALKDVKFSNIVYHASKVLFEDQTVAGIVAQTERYDRVEVLASAIYKRLGEVYGLNPRVVQKALPFENFDVPMVRPDGITVGTPTQLGELLEDIVDLAANGVPVAAGGAVGGV
jgi:hypothetical protein